MSEIVFAALATSGFSLPRNINFSVLLMRSLTLGYIWVCGQLLDYPTLIVASIPDFQQNILWTTKYIFTGEIENPIKPVPIIDMPELFNFVENMQIFSNECFRNAALISLYFDTLSIEVNYVEGEVYDQENLIHHAWNYIPSLNAYVDLTWEKFIPNNLVLDYYPIINEKITILQNKYNAEKTQIGWSYLEQWKEDAFFNADESTPIWWMALTEALFDNKRPH